MLLSHEGRQAARRILWCVQQLHGGEVEFCPILPGLICALLSYGMPEAEA